MSYTTLLSCMNLNNCKLITTEKEYLLLKNITTFPKIDYIASCGHNNNVHSHIFKSRGTGIKCSACVSKTLCIIKRGENSRTENGCKNIQKVFKTYMETGVRPEKYRREYKFQ